VNIEEIRQSNDGKPLDMFRGGDCIRLVYTSFIPDKDRIGDLYLVGTVNKAYNLQSGVSRTEGLFVLVNAKVVVEP
jgi:hypothetical protein